MRNNLQLYYTMLNQMTKWLPDERVTRLRNLALFLTRLYLAASVHLGHVVRKWHTPGKLPSLANRLRRFLDNPRVCVHDLYRPVAQQLIAAFSGQPIRLIIDCTKLGFDLEATHLRDLDRLSCLMLGVCLVYTCLIALSSWVVKRGLRHLIDRKDRRDKSYFRIGWDWLERTLSQGKLLRLQFAPYT